MNKYFQAILGALLFAGFVQPAHSQRPEGSTDKPMKRFEIGGQFTFLRRADADPFFENIIENEAPNPSAIQTARLSELGFGARFGYNFTKNIAVEVEANFFPVNKKNESQIGDRVRILEPGGRKIQGFAGPKIGIRKEKFGVFGKVRPGLLSIERYLGVAASGPYFVLGYTVHWPTFFAVDVGGVFEYYPSRHTVLRLDAGDTIIRYSAQPPKDINPSFTRNNFQTSVGFGFRF